MTIARKALYGTALAAVGVLASALLVIMADARVPDGHNPGHVGCKHGHGSTWLQNHSRRHRGAADDEDGAPRRLRPFTAVGR